MAFYELKGVKNCEDGKSPVTMVDIKLLTARALTLMLLGEQTRRCTKTLKPHFALERSLKRKGQDSKPITPCRLDIAEKTLTFVNTTMRTSDFSHLILLY